MTYFRTERKGRSNHVAGGLKERGLERRMKSRRSLKVKMGFQTVFAMPIFLYVARGSVAMGQERYRVEATTPSNHAVTFASLLYPDCEHSDASLNKTLDLPSPLIHLPHLPGHLRRRTLRTHFAHHPPYLSPRRSRRTLRLLHLLLALGGGFLFLTGLDGFLAGGGSGFWTLRSALFDHLEGGADDASLLLDGAAGTFFGDFLLLRGFGLALGI